MIFHVAKDRCLPSWLLLRLLPPLHLKHFRQHLPLTLHPLSPLWHPPRWSHD